MAAVVGVIAGAVAVRAIFFVNENAENSIKTVMHLYESLLRNRLTQLRMEKSVPARDMSVSLGQSESDINKIENGRAMPSMEVFFCICEYFGIHPKDFFAREAAWWRLNS